ncbi:MAG: Crp/Fnr family transcriptional regulator [Gracilibacteraceae bacterium]|jgi:CRP-like cAMP-binding protein|nr:Crp/Fnr family transcriptional regulator [Gracilibacteraceae bacterium]
MVKINHNKFNYYSPVDLEDHLWESMLDIGYTKNFGPSETLISQGQQLTGLLCVTQGRLKTFYIFNNGNEKILGLFNTQYSKVVLGEEAIFDSRTSFYNAMALTPLSMVYIPFEKVRTLIAECPEIAVCLLKCLSNKLSSLGIQVGDLLSRDIMQRAARVLTDFTKCTSKNKEGYMPFTHDELAKFLGITRPNMTTCLNYFARENLIDMRWGKIRVTDYTTLKNLSDS